MGPRGGRAGGKLLPQESLPFERFTFCLYLIGSARLKAHGLGGLGTIVQLDDNYAILVKFTNKKAILVHYNYIIILLQSTNHLAVTVQSDDN